VLSSVQYLDRAMLPADWPGDRVDEVLIRGGSSIVGPLGEELAGPLYGREGVLLAEVDTGTLPRVRYDLDVSGHYARPDVFALEVDTRDRGLA
jgi:nitrilase